MNKQALYRDCESLQLLFCNPLSGINGTFSERFDRPNLFTVAIKDEPPWSFESPPGSGCFCGISISLLAIVGRKLGLRLFLRLETPDSQFKTSDGTQYSGNLAELLRGYVNMSVRASSVTHARTKHFKMIVTYPMRKYQAAMHERWLVDPDGVTRSLMYAIFYAPLADLWPILLLTTVSVVVVLVYSQHALRNGRRTRSGPPRRSSLQSRISAFGCGCLQTTYRVLASFFSQDDVTTEHQRPSGSGVRFMIIVWLLSSYFTSTLMYTHVTSSLTGSRLRAPFRVVDELVRSDFSPLLLSSADSELEFMNNTALSPLLTRVRRLDEALPFDERIRLAANLSLTSQLVIFTTEEKPYFQKVRFTVAIDTVYQTFVGIFQLPFESKVDLGITDIIIRMAKSGSLKRISGVHTELLRRAYGTTAADQLKPLKKRNISIRLESLLSVGYTGLGFFGVATVVFLVELYVHKRKQELTCYGRKGVT